MYEQNDVPTLRRVLRALLGLIALVAVLWFIVWALFLRNPSTKTGQKTGQSPTTSNNKTTPQQPSGNSNGTAPPPTSGSTNNKNNGGQQPSTPPPANGSANAPSLANTGPGDVVLPFVTATIAGAAIYQVRLRRKVTR